MTDWDTRAAEAYPTATVIETVGDEFIVVYPLLFHWTMIRGLKEDVFVGYEDRWCYADELLAVTAFSEWKARNFEGEPTGWHRHPPTGRRRPNGDPEQEYIAH